MGLSFSIDMIRLETSVDLDDFQTLVTNNFFNNIYVQLYIGRGITEYHYNYKINEEYCLKDPFGELDGTNNFYVAYKHNKEKRSLLGNDRYKLVVEYNPNKCDITAGLLNKVLSSFFTNLVNVRVKKCDVCCDFYDIQMNTVSYDKGRKMSENVRKTSKGHTIYLGDSGSQGYIKIYDKGAEQKIDKTWTRWEVTLKVNCDATALLADLVTNKHLKIDLPTVYFGNNGFSDDDILLSCASYAVKTGFRRLSDFSKYYRNKIKPILSSSALHSIGNADVPDIINSIGTYLKSYIAQLGISGYSNMEEIFNSIFKIQQSSEFHQMELANDF